MNAIPSFIVGSIPTKAGEIPQISTSWDIKDWLGTIKVRTAFGRSSYTVKPGLYAIGNPDENSDVLVTSNYKLTFDIVRKNCIYLNIWLLVLDTKGVNVWCAAGKKTFGTAELIRKIHETSLHQIVKHRRIIVPQLGAPGISAAEVRKGSAPIQKNEKIVNNQTIESKTYNNFIKIAKPDTGFTVLFGPVRASDIKTYLTNRYKASNEMRTVKFTLKDRLILIPVEFVLGLKYLAALLVLLILISGISMQGISFTSMSSQTYPVIINSLMAYIAGTFVAPLLLPYLPFRSFSMKGFIIGIIFYISMFYFDLTGNTLQSLAWLFVYSTLPSFMTMNFTGTSNYTSLSGVLKEMKIAIPLQIGVGVLALATFILNQFIK